MEPIVNLKLAQDHGLTENEYREIEKILGRVPSYTELGIFSAMWSEHCSYKNSIFHLKKLPTTSERTLTKAGEENAGAIDIGDGLAVVFKVESHNHPSAIEPYQGAATGVGGIMRDIFTMGARPIACLNSLRFGNPQKALVRHQLRGVVKGIGDYGNCLGIPTVAGEIYFEDIYETNPLVNAMVVGIARHEDIAFSRAEGEGNTVMIVGSTTGRDGIHGASFASQDLSEKSEEKKSAVQVGDPFMEKLLLEATLELLKSGIVIGIQDMGAAGISCATSEMSGKTGHGMRIHLENVPVREKGMSAYEIMLSESQERMLVVVKKGFEEQAKEIVKKWDLHAAIVGEVTKDGNVSVFSKNELKAYIPSKSLILGGGAPVYQREYKRPSILDELQAFDVKKFLDEVYRESIATPLEILSRLLGAPNLASRRPVYNQYDYQVGIGTMEGPGSDAAIMRLHHYNTKKGIAATIDCNGRQVYLDPEKGAGLAVCEAARNLACSGANPVGVTNCLNFANPYIPENFYFFAKAVEGMGKACSAFELPITGGNVSFYNESPKGPVYPTPTIGMVGVLPDIDHYASLRKGRPGMKIYLAGWFRPTLGGSEYLNFIHGKTAGPLPELDFAKEKILRAFLQKTIQKGMIQVAHDISDGGIAITLLEMAFYAKVGLSIDLSHLLHFFTESQSNLDGFSLTDSYFPHLILFGETSASALIAIPEKLSLPIENIALEKSLPLIPLGHMNDAENIQKIQLFFTKSGEKKSWIEENWVTLNNIWQNGLTRFFDNTRA
jgi:phosphoribosylformylglycinamidine synthase